MGKLFIKHSMNKTKKELYQAPTLTPVPLDQGLSILFTFSVQGEVDDIIDNGEVWED